MNFERLRALLLEQAIRGELVEQQARDSAVLVVDGVLPKESYPFEIPDHWKWYPLGKIVEYGKGTQIGSGEISETTWVLDLEDIEKGTGCLLNKKRGTPTTSNKTKFCKGDVLYGKLRPYLNKVLVADEDGVCTTEIVPIRVVTAKLPLLAEYLQSYLMSPFFLDYANKISYGVKMPRLGTKDAKAALIPVPPIEEQTRIVTKLDEAFAEIDRAEKAYGELQTLAGVLRGQILQEAIEGKLVPQLAEEGVVEQIGGAPEEVPFEIPESWKWVQMNGICTLKSGVDMSPSVLLNEPVINAIPYITGGSQIGQSGELLITRWTSKATNISEEGDVLLICKGSGLGRTALNSYGSVHIARQIMAIRKTKEVIPQYLDLLLKWHWETLRSAAKGVIPGIARKDVLSLLVPLPPVTEQVRIVAKVEELMKQVDGLSA